MPSRSEVQPSHRVTDSWTNLTLLPPALVNAGGVQRQIWNRFTQQLQSRTGAQGSDQPQPPSIHTLALELLQELEGGLTIADLINKQNHPGVGFDPLWA